MAIFDYKIQAKRQEVRVCPKHKGHPLSLGCKTCVQLFCVHCLSLSEIKSCIAGKYLVYILCIVPSDIYLSQWL